MSGISDFAIDMARAVFARKMKDEEIVSMFQAKYPDMDEAWIRGEIQKTKDDPGLYRPMATMWTLDDTVAMLVGHNIEKGHKEAAEEILRLAGGKKEGE